MFNKIILMGRLTADPEFRQTQTGIAMCNFNIAIDRPQSKNQASFQGNPQTPTADFFRVIAWRYAAEFAAKYFKKGLMVIVEGKVQNNNYTDQQGVKHYSMQVIADNVSFGETRASAEARGVITQQNPNFQNGGYNQQIYNQNGGYNTTPQNPGQYGGYNPQTPQTTYNQPNYSQNQGQYNPQAPQNQGQYNPPNTQIPPNGAAQTTQTQQNTSLKEFDEIISDGDVPF